MIKAYIGKMRSGKTLAMTQEVIARLDRGEVVYTNYRVNWDPLAPMSYTRRIFHRLGFKKRRYPQSNLRRFNNWEDVQNVANCTVALDEGWQYFDSYNKLPIEKRMRLYQSGKWELTFLYTVQRYMMADINLRWSTDEYWESTLYKIPFLPYPLVIYRLYDLEEDNEGAKLARRGIKPDGEVVDLSLARRILFTRKKHFDAYDTKEDIYATDLYRKTLSTKVDAHTADSGGYLDPLPSIWDVLGKYVPRKSKLQKNDDRRDTRVKTPSPPSVAGTVVARIPRRNHIINDTVAGDSFLRRLMSHKIYSTPPKKPLVNPSLYNGQSHVASSVRKLKPEATSFLGTKQLRVQSRR